MCGAGASRPADRRGVRRVRLRHPDDDGGVQVWSSVQHPFLLQKVLAQILDLPLARVRVHAPDPGGGFGGKLTVYLEPIAAAGGDKEGWVDRFVTWRSDLVKRVAADRTVLMVEHNLSVVANLSDHITVLARGEVIAEGNYQQVSKDPAVVQAYLGSEHA